MFSYRQNQHKPRLQARDIIEFVPRETLDDKGNITIENVPAKEIAIPDPEDYDLEKLLAAGVTLNYVNTNIIDSNDLTDELTEKKIIEKLAAIPDLSDDAAVHSPVFDDSDNINPNNTK